MSKLKRWRLVEIVKPGSGIVPVEKSRQGHPDLDASAELWRK